MEYDDSRPQPPLLDKRVARGLAKVIFSESHGAFGEHLGAGGLYYALAMMNRAQVSVCIGSGGGFVPRLLRQAQMDLDLGNACTYLVDADLPDLGFGHPRQKGGWLTDDNDLDAAPQDLAVLRMLSKDAAQLFATAGIVIDYLHIDGDHSARGVVEDLVDYLPLLSPRAIVSLHDLRMASVQQAMAEIGRRYPALEWVTFTEIGNGSAVLRRRCGALPEVLPLSLAGTDDPRRRVRLAPAMAETEVRRSQEKARYERWHYLTTPGYRARYDLAARWLDQPGLTIVELGGFPNSIVRHLTRAKRVVAIEPYAPQAYLDEIQAAAAEAGIDLLVKRGTLGAIAIDTALFGTYGFVALGLDISAGSATAGAFEGALGPLVDLVAGAEIAAVEVSAYPPSQAALDSLLACMARPAIQQDITLDLREDPAADAYYVKDARAIRRLRVFRPGDVIPREQRGPILAAGAAAYARFLAEHTPDISAKFGETLRFTAGSGLQRLLPRGWSGLEPNFVWAIDKVSKIEFEIADLPEAPEPLRLTLELVAFTLEGVLPGQRLAVIVNGTRLFKGVLARGNVLDLALPYELVERRRITEITLIHPDGKRPQDVGIHARDDRVLSFQLRSLTLGRAPGEAPAG